MSTPKPKTFFTRIFGEKKEPKPGKFTKKEKYEIWDLNPNLPRTTDSTILRWAINLPPSYVEREKRYKDTARRKKKEEMLTKRFAQRGTIRQSLARQSSKNSDYGDNVNYLDNNDIDTFLSKQGIRTIKGGIKNNTRKQKRRQKTRKNRK
jgi:hypothetical protein